MKRNFPVLMAFLAVIGCKNPIITTTPIPPAEYVVSFDSRLATTAAVPDRITVSAPMTTVVSLPSAPLKSGYGFGGWWTAINGGGTAFTANTPVSADIAVYARWDSHSYTISFDSQEATVPADPSSMTVSSPATTLTVFPTKPEKDGQVFNGWWTAESGGGTQFTSTTTVDKSLTVYARWTTAPPVVLIWGSTSWGMAVWQ